MWWLEAQIIREMDHNIPNHKKIITNEDVISTKQTGKN